MAKYVLVRSHEELRAARAAGVLWYKSPWTGVEEPARLRSDKAWEDLVLTRRGYGIRVEDTDDG